MKHWMVTIFLLASFSVNAATNVGTIGYLASACSIEIPDDVIKAYDQGYCYGALNTSLRYISVIEPLVNSFSLPENITIGQLKAVFLKWANQNPELWHKSDHIGMTQAVLSAFPKEN